MNRRFEQYSQVGPDATPANGCVAHGEAWIAGTSVTIVFLVIAIGVLFYKKYQDNLDKTSLTNRLRCLEDGALGSLPPSRGRARLRTPLGEASGADVN